MKVILLSLLFCLLFCFSAAANDVSADIYILDDVIIKLDDKVIGRQFRVVNYCNAGTVWQLGIHYDAIQIMVPGKKFTPMSCEEYKERKVNE